MGTHHAPDNNLISLHIYSFNLPDIEMKLVLLLYPFYKYENWDPERLSNLLSVTQIEISRAGI